MRVYLDSSAALKRVLVESESVDLVAALDGYHAEGDVFISSSLAWIEVARVLRSLRSASLVEVTDEVNAALSGVAEHPLVAEVVALTRRVNPAVLRSLDAIHLASAHLVDADLVLTYDQRLAAACRRGGLAVAAPGSTSIIPVSTEENPASAERLGRVIPGQRRAWCRTAACPGRVRSGGTGSRAVACGPGVSARSPGSCSR